MRTKMSKNYQNGRNGQRTLHYDPKEATSLGVYGGNRIHRRDGGVSLAIRGRDGTFHIEYFNGTDCATDITEYVTANFFGRRVPIKTDSETWRNKRVDRLSLVRRLTEVVNGNGK